MTNHNTITAETETDVTDALEVIEALASIDALEQELARAKQDLGTLVLPMEEDLKYDCTVAWPCVDCGGPIIIRKLETLRWVLKAGGRYAHGDC